MKAEKIVKEVGKRWNFLMTLYENEDYLMHLAEKLSKNKADTSVYLKKLGEYNLITFEYRKEEKTRRKYFKLSERGREIVEFFLNIEKPLTNKDTETLNHKKIERCLNGLDKNLEVEIQKNFAYSFELLCRHYDVWRNVEVQKLFKNMTKKPDSYSDDVGRILFNGYIESINRTINDTNGLKWFNTNLYNQIEKNVKNKKLNDDLREYFIRALDRVFNNNNKKRKKIMDIAFKVTFDDNTEINSKTYNSSTSIIGKGVNYQKEDNSLYEEIFEKLLQLAKNKSGTKKIKAEKILEIYIRDLQFL